MYVWTLPAPCVCWHNPNTEHTPSLAQPEHVLVLVPSPMRHDIVAVVLS